jgi:hypothetical protein
MRTSKPGASGQALTTFSATAGATGICWLSTGQRTAPRIYAARKIDAGWEASNVATFDLRTGALRSEGWTSSDAAGLPVFPATVRYDECERGVVEHTMRVTVRRSRRAYVLPATHFASRLTDPDLPRMGKGSAAPRFRYFRIPPHARAILEVEEIRDVRG